MLTHVFLLKLTLFSGGSKEACDPYSPPPDGPKFSCSFSENSVKLYVAPSPPAGGLAPLATEILDPPLLFIYLFTHQLFTLINVAAIFLLLLVHSDLARSVLHAHLEPRDDHVFYLCILG